MILFFRFTAIYFAAATAWNYFFRGDLLFVGDKVLSVGTRAFGMMSFFAIGFVFFVVWVWMKCESPKEFVKRLGRAVVMLILCCLFLAAFTSVKSSLPYMAQLLGFEVFFADPFFAKLDQILHFGVDPWVLSHDLTEITGWDNFAVHASLIYGPVWLVLAFYLPVIMAFVGDDERTIKHYVILYAFSWVVLGNVFALIGQSGGPIFYDRIFETARFGDLTATLDASSSMANSWFSIVQPGLWDNYVSGDQAIGSGISAFPSLHVGMIMVAALYLAEKHMFLRAFGIFMVIGVMFSSVWVGFHYAIDGYFSIVAIYVAHVWLRRRDVTRANSDPAGAALANA